MTTLLNKHYLTHLPENALYHFHTEKCKSFSYFSHSNSSAQKKTQGGGAGGGGGGVGCRGELPKFEI